MLWRAAAQLRKLGLLAREVRQFSWKFLSGTWGCPCTSHTAEPTRTARHAGSTPQTKWHMTGSDVRHVIVMAPHLGLGDALVLTVHQRPLAQLAALDPLLKLLLAHKEIVHTMLLPWPHRPAHVQASAYRASVLLDRVHVWAKVNCLQTQGLISQRPQAVHPPDSRKAVSSPCRSSEVGCMAWVRVQITSSTS